MVRTRSKIKGQGYPYPLYSARRFWSSPTLATSGVVFAQLSRTGRTLAAEEAVRAFEDPHAVDGVPRDVHEISGADGDEFVAAQMDGAPLKHVNELLIIGVVVGRRTFAVLVGDDTDLDELAPKTGSS